MKRVLIPSPCSITTLLLSSHTVGVAGVRYNITMLPHLHQMARRWKDTVNPAQRTFHPYAITCTRQLCNPPQMGITCIFWNSMKAALPTVRSILYDLLCEEAPHVVVVLGSSVDPSDLPSMAGPAGFNGLYQVDAEGYDPGMFIIWRPMFVSLTKLLSQINCINVLIEVTRYSILLYALTSTYNLKHFMQPEVMDQRQYVRSSGMSSNTHYTT